MALFLIKFALYLNEQSFLLNKKPSHISEYTKIKKTDFIEGVLTPHKKTKKTVLKEIYKPKIDRVTPIIEKKPSKTYKALYKHQTNKFNSNILDRPENWEISVFQNIKKQDILNKPVCKHKYTSPSNCRDPVSYIVKNENKNWLFAPYIKNLSKGYVGVGSDANYSYIAFAKSTWVWLFDFDMNIVNLHKLLRIFILQSENPESFVDKFHYKNAKSSIELLGLFVRENDEKMELKRIFKNYRNALYKNYNLSLKQKGQGKEFGWLSNSSSYQYIRLLYTQKRIAILPGDMLKENTMRSIAKVAKELGVVIRVYYPSNAENFWKFTKIYKENIQSLPFDSESVIISTTGNHWHPKGYKGSYWHYVVRGALNFQKRLATGYDSIDRFLPLRRLSSTHKELSTVELTNIEVD
ncbi:MAG: hypothetical protein H7A23_16095 [Leptospiraceae bacterium]|nr:hypothetical protein [Leptospiraceae bacterium]MCP5496068.1 hypothetical protein [Leptospiraceae bacterium]